MSIRSFSTEFKLEVVLAYQSGDYTMKEICRKYRISKYSLIDWMKRFEKSGIQGLKKSTSWKRYSKSKGRSCAGLFVG
jgi:transposase